MTLVKVAEPPRICRDPGHLPPKMIVLQPGTYEYTCGSCGEVAKFTVPQVTL